MPGPTPEPPREERIKAAWDSEGGSELKTFRIPPYGSDYQVGVTLPTITVNGIRIGGIKVGEWVKAPAALEGILLAKMGASPEPKDEVQEATKENTKVIDPGNTARTPL